MPLPMVLATVPAAKAAAMGSASVAAFALAHLVPPTLTVHIKTWNFVVVVLVPIPLVASLFPS